MIFLHRFIGKRDKDGGEKMGQVSIHAAFDSPNTLANATEFLRNYGQESSAQAALAIVPKHKIAYPQVISRSLFITNLGQIKALVIFQVPSF